MKIELRKENTSDYRIVEEVTREAFWNHYIPGCSEHYIAHILREADGFIENLSLVAEADNQIVGSIMYSKAKILCDNEKMVPVVTFGPLSVLPDYQGNGVGGQLVSQTLKMAKDMGFNAVLITGDPEYYSKFGFVGAERYGIAMPDDEYYDALLAYELETGALSDCDGMFFVDSAFEVSEETAEEFDQGFAPKEKIEGTPSQQKFLAMLECHRPKIRVIEKNNQKIAMLNCGRIVIDNVNAAMDFVMSVNYEVGTTKIAINKEAIVEEFFDLSTRLAGEILQKFINYHVQIAIYGDFSVYDSKALHDFIYECNKGKDFFFVITEEEAIEKLSK